MKEYSIASIAGDGIGKEVVPEAQKILKEISQQHQFKLNIEDYDFASCDYYEKHGKMTVSYTHLTLPTNREV